MSLRDKILSTDDIESELVEVPAWGVTLEVRSMDARSRTRLIRSATSEDGKVEMEHLYPDTVMMCTYDPETGERVFNDDDRELLLSKSAAAIELLAMTAMKVSGLSTDAATAAGKELPLTGNEDSSLS